MCFFRNSRILQMWGWLLFLYIYICIMSAIPSESDSLTNSIELQAMFSSLSFHSWSSETRRAIYPVIYKYMCIQMHVYMCVCVCIFSTPLWNTWSTAFLKWGAAAAVCYRHGHTHDVCVILNSLLVLFECRRTQILLTNTWNPQPKQTRTLEIPKKKKQNKKPFGMLFEIYFSGIRGMRTVFIHKACAAKSQPNST